MERYEPDQYGRMMPDAHGRWVSLRAAELTALDAAQKSSADAQATMEALQRERDALKLVNETHMKTVMKLSHIVEQSGAALDAEREKGQAIIKDTKNMIDVATRSLWEQLTQLQALVRALLDTWVNGRKIHDGIPMTLRQQIDATLGVTTPAPDTSIIGKCEPPSQWDPNAQVRGDIS